jgi:hypothetical protein
MGRRTLVALFVGMATLLAVPSVASANVRYFGADEVVRGQDLRHWGADWFETLIEQPTPTNPLANPSLCGTAGPNQSMFMTSSGGGVNEVACTVKQHTLLVFMPGGIFFTEDPDHTTKDSIRQATLDLMKQGVVAQPRLRIDGKYYRVADHRFNGPFFTLNMTANNPFGVPAGPYLTYASGWAALVVLPLGHHNVYISDILVGQLAATKLHINVVN